MVYLSQASRLLAPARAALASNSASSIALVFLGEGRYRYILTIVSLPASNIATRRVCGRPWDGSLRPWHCCKMPQMGWASTLLAESRKEEDDIHEMSPTSGWAEVHS